MLKVSNLKKEYDRVVAVDGISLTVNRGELFGLLGPNGAGKTTTIRTVLNIIQPDAGEITFDGKPFSPELWNNIGYLPEERGLYRKSKIINTILYFASLKGMSERDAKPRVHYWLGRFGLKDSAHRKVEELSKGNQQKVQLICSILHKPQLLILDEPFSGLDPVNQILLKDILLELRQQDVAIVFSTHQMEQVEKLCDNICLINKGKVVLSGALHDVKKRYGTNSVRLEYEGDGAFLKTLPFIKQADVYQNYAELELVDIRQSRELLGSLDNKLSLRKFEIIEPSLHSIFVNVVGLPEQTEPPLAPASVQPKPAAPPLDALAKRALISMAFAGMMTVILGIVQFSKEDPNWFLPGVMAAALLFSTYRFFKVREDAAKKPLPEAKRETP